MFKTKKDSNHDFDSQIKKNILLAIPCCIALGFGMYKFVHKRRKTQLLTQIINKKLKIIDDKFKAFANIPRLEPQKEILITKSTTKELLNLLNQDILTSEELLKFYARRTAIIGRKYNYTTEIEDFDKILAYARQCDQVRKSTPHDERYKLGLLYGIPISLKDGFEQEGFDTTIGMSTKLFKPAKQDGLATYLLKAQGAIPFVKTNTPQQMATIETNNYIWKRALNPWDATRNTGGSSGGEAGMISSGCSPIGLSSDALGSIRVPAAFCGLYGIRPTAERITLMGHAQMSKQNIGKLIPSKMACLGPIGRSVDDLELILKCLIHEESRLTDPSIPYVPWNEGYKLPNKLRIAYMDSDNLFGTAGVCKRAVRESVETYKNLGHDVFEVKVPNFEKIALLAIQILSSEGKCRSIVDFLEGEPIQPEQALQVLLSGIPKSLMKSIGLILKALGKERAYIFLKNSQELTSNGLLVKFWELINYKAEFFRFWRENHIDALILPACVTPAFINGYAKFLLSFGIGYSTLASLMNLSAGIVPVTLVKEDEQGYTKNDIVYDDLFQKKLNEIMNKSAGLPVGIQICTLPYEDEKCIAVMRLLEQQIKFNKLAPIAYVNDN